MRAWARVIRIASGSAFTAIVAAAGVLGSAALASDLPAMDPASAAAAERGKPLYEKRCASCHDQPTGSVVSGASSQGEPGNALLVFEVAAP